MITSPNQQPTSIRRTRTRWETAIALIRWRSLIAYSSPIWLALRLYIAWIWFQMSMGSPSGWLTSDPVGQMFKLIEKGTIAVPLPFYRGVAGASAGCGIFAIISHSMPFSKWRGRAPLRWLPACWFQQQRGRNSAEHQYNSVRHRHSGVRRPNHRGRVLFVMSYRVVGGIGFEGLAQRILERGAGSGSPGAQIRVDVRV